MDAEPSRSFDLAWLADDAFAASELAMGEPAPRGSGDRLCRCPREA